MAAVGGGGGSSSSDAGHSAASLSGKKAGWAELSNLDVCFLSKILTKCHARFRQEHLLQPGQT